jgi:phosphoglycerol transferase MdoB-like AlkP superfamily enzyme
LEPRDDVKEVLHSLIFAVMFGLLFLILLPLVVKLIDERTGKILYGALAAGAVGVAIRLRFVARKI